MAEHDHQIDAASEFTKLGADSLDDVDRDQASAYMDLVPLGDLRRRNADHTYFEPLRRSGLVDERAFDHDRGRKPGRAIAFADVAADDGKARLRISALERLQAVVEIVVPQRRDVIVKRVHGGDDGMDRAGVRKYRLGGEVAERRALKNVAVIEQQAVGGLPAGLPD